MALFLLVFLCGGPSGFAQPKDISELDRYFEQARQDWQVPGLAVAIVQDGEIVLSKGYGVREKGKDAPVDGQTLFAMASTTKATVAAAMATLVDAGLVDWDDPVVQHLPEFRLSVPYVTQTARIRDLFTHNLGLGNADFLWIHGEFSDQEILERMAQMDLSYPFRGGYTYQNIMYLVAGMVIERVSGLEWAEFMKQRLYAPIGLQRTFPLRQQVLEQENRTRPHHTVDGEIVPIEDMVADEIAPAGASWSCVDDMARWMLFLLDTARVGGRQILQPGTWSELFKPQVIIPKSDFYPTHRLTRPTWTTYGLGWFQHEYRGETVQFHTGSLNGTVAICGLLPAKNLGVYVFGNLDHAEVRHAIMYQVFDLLGFRRSDRDWSADCQALYGDLQQASSERQTRMENNRVANTSPSLPLADYTGTYAHPVWGHIQVKLAPSGDHLLGQVGKITYADLNHWHYDTFRADHHTAGYGPVSVQFFLDPRGEVAALQWGGDRYRFRKTK